MVQHLQSCNKKTKLDHDYVANSSHAQCFQDFMACKRSINTTFDPVAVMTNLKPATADPERLFSFGRFSKNYLQSGMIPSHHDRNVFLKKSAHFII